MKTKNKSELLKRRAAAKALGKRNATEVSYDAWCDLVTFNCTECAIATHRLFNELLEGAYNPHNSKCGVCKRRVEIIEEGAWAKLKRLFLFAKRG